MAETSVLNAVARPGTGKGAARQARREGYIPGVVYGGGEAPVSINIKSNELLKELKAGRFLTRLVMLRVDGKDTRVICRSVQRDVVKDLPIHVDFFRLSERSLINLFIPVEFVDREKSQGLRRGGVLQVVRPEIELVVTAGDIPDKITASLDGLDINDTIHISNVTLPAGARPTITDRDFVIANITAPSGLKAAEAEAAEEEEAAEA